MALQPINIPDDIEQLSHSTAAARLIELAHDRIETFMSEHDSVTENFVRCDFHLLDQSLKWIQENHLLTGNRFCELGSGFGVGAMLASLHGMDSVGIEIESDLVHHSTDLADHLNLSAKFYCGSFIPRDVSGILDLSREVEHVETHEDDMYEEIGLDMDEFDLFFAFPWPGESHFFEAVFESGAAEHALLLTYDGRNGMHLFRKV